MNSSRLAGGISSIFLDSPFVWRNVFSKIISLSVFAQYFWFLGHPLSPRGERIVASPPPFFFIQLKKPAFFHRRVYSDTIVMWKSFAPLIGRTIHAQCRYAFWLFSCIFSYEFNAPFLLWVNLSMCKIKIIILTYRRGGGFLILA